MTGERRGGLGPEEATPEIRALTGLRGPASLLVVVWHANLIWVAAFPALAGLTDFSARMAAVSVDLFFVLSGFVMTYVYAAVMARPTQSSVTAFWVRRVARLWPLHVATTLVMCVGHLALPAQDAAEGLFSAGNIAANVLMLHEFGPFEAINLPAWSVAPEMGAYLAFPLIAATLLRVRWGWLLGLSATAVLLLGSAWIDQLYAGTDPGRWSHAIAWARLAVGFLAGCLVARAWTDLPARLRNNRFWDALALLSLVYVVVLALAPHRWFERGVPAWSFPFLALAVLGAAGAAGPVGAALSGRMMNYLGRISYALYLTHFPAIVVITHVLTGLGFAGRPVFLRVVILAVVVAVLLAIADLAHRFLEEPARRWFRWRLGAANRASAASSPVRRGNVAP